jgi:putative ABC transport system permease protein
MRERRRIRPGEQDNFLIRDLQSVSSLVESTTTLLTAGLSAVAAISLLVGGIGIMNIMLVSVTERTREIGIRLAIGALERDVLLQFLIEAILLSCVGGLIGALLGLGGSAAIAYAIGVPFVLSPWVIVVAFAFSAAVGIVFGFFPARRAASLDPIDALRYE